MNTVMSSVLPLELLSGFLVLYLAVRLSVRRDRIVVGTAVTVWWIVTWKWSREPGRDQS